MLSIFMSDYRAMAYNLHKTSTYALHVNDTYPLAIGSDVV